MSQERQPELVQSIYQLVGPTAPVLVLGDGEFDGTLLLARLQSNGWEYVVRTAKNALVYDGERRFPLEALEVMLVFVIIEIRTIISLIPTFSAKRFIPG